MFRAYLVEIILTALILTGFWAFLSLLKTPKAKVIFCPTGTDHVGDVLHDDNSPSGTSFACRNCTYKVNL
jgi:hypothetical protein